MSLRRLPLVRVVAGGASLLAFSLAAHSFEAVDLLRPSSSGRYPAYETEALAAPLTELWVQGGVMVDNNILRRSDAPPTETVLRLGAGGRKDTYVYGRQLVRLEGLVDGYWFNRFSELDNFAYGALGEWHWELGNDLSGVLGASQRRYQRSLAYIQAPVRDMVTETRYTANGAYRLGPSFRVRAGADLADYKDPFFINGRVQTTAGVVGLDYVSGLGNTLGVEYRQTQGDAPVPITVDPTLTFANNDFTERTVALAAGYLSPFIRLAADIGRTKRTYTEIPAHDFEGTTWRGTLDWLVTTKTALGFETYYEPHSAILLNASHVVVRGISFGPGWAPTAKLNFSARVMRERQEYGLEPGAAATGLPAELDILRNVRLGAYWEYTRQIHWTFAIDHGTRESNILNRDYRYNAIMANVRYLFW